MGKAADMGEIVAARGESPQPVNATVDTAANTPLDGAGLVAKTRNAADIPSFLRLASVAD